MTKLTPTDESAMGTVTAELTFSDILKADKGLGERIMKTNALVGEPAEAPDANGWLPIETAPRDGTFILVAHEGGHRNIVQWCQDQFWRTNLSNPFHWQPTHWQPIPNPPKE